MNKTVVDADGDGLMNIDEFKTFIHAVTNVKSIVEQWGTISGSLTPAELSSLPGNIALVSFQHSRILTSYSRFLISY